MTIHTIACEPTEFIRVIGAFDQPSVNKYLGKVGRTLSHGKNELDSDEMFFVQMHGESAIKVFAMKQVEFITEKEYFIGCLSG